MVSFTYQICTLKEEITPFLPLLQQLSPTLTAERLDMMLDDMLAHDYRLLAVWSENRCVGVSGFWVSTKIYSGRYLEMDNVVVDAEWRSKGVGKCMSDFLTEWARNEGCRFLMLDAYIENEKAHRFYEREGFDKRGYHFLKKII